MNSTPDNLSIYDTTWHAWVDMKRFGPASRWLRALIKDACKAMRAPPESIHDVGCGVGTNTVYMAELFPGARVRGSDFSEAAIDASIRYAAGTGVQFVHDPDNEALDEPAGMVSCFEVLEHVDDWRTFLARLTASATDYVLLSFPTGRMRPFEVNVGHLRNFRAGEIEAQMGRLSFVPVYLAYAGFPFYSPLYRDFCQATNAGDAEFTKGRYGVSKRLLSWMIYVAFRFFSTQRRHGDQFVGLFARQELRPDGQ